MATKKKTKSTETKIPRKPVKPWDTNGLILMHYRKGDAVGVLYDRSAHRFTAALVGTKVSSYHQDTQTRAGRRSNGRSAWFESLKAVNAFADKLAEESKSVRKRSVVILDPYIKTNDDVEVGQVHVEGGRMIFTDSNGSKQLRWSSGDILFYRQSDLAKVRRVVEKRNKLSKQVLALTDEIKKLACDSIHGSSIGYDIQKIDRIDP